MVVIFVVVVATEENPITAAFLIEKQIDRAGVVLVFVPAADDDCYYGNDDNDD